MPPQASLAVVSPVDVRPLLDAVARNAALTCEADMAFIDLRDGQVTRRVGHHGGDTPDTLDGARLTLPLLSAGIAIGTIEVRRADSLPFTDRHTALLRAFADQAVLAVENIRLVDELQSTAWGLTQSLRDTSALGNISQAIGASLDLQAVLDSIVEHAVRLSDSEGCGIYQLDAQRNAYDIVASFNLSPRFLDAISATPIGPRGSVLRRAAERGEALQVPDVLVAQDVHAREALLDEGFRSLLAVPMVDGDELRGILLYRRPPGHFDGRVVNLLSALANQSRVAIHNARLFRESEDKGRQLELASRHKSEFLANMSHELRTPLGAVIGYAEVLLEQVFGELNAKQTEYLASILSSGRHQLSLINDILDLSKVEAGRLDLDLTTFAVAEVLEDALALVRGPASRYGVTLALDVDASVGDITADERKVKQVVLNLLANALKFTPEGGRVDVLARPGDGCVEVAVRDTGVGIAAADQQMIFEEFRQVRGSARKHEGTGLGLALARKLVLLHGGTIGVRSAPGSGSTFTFTLPLDGAPGEAVASPA